LKSISTMLFTIVQVPDSRGHAQCPWQPGRRGPRQTSIGYAQMLPGWGGKLSSGRAASHPLTELDRAGGRLSLRVRVAHWKRCLSATGGPEFVHYYNHDRPHRTIELETPVPSPPISRGDVVSRPIVGGLHHVYARAA